MKVFSLFFALVLTACTATHDNLSSQIAEENVQLGMAYLKAGSTEEAKSKLLAALDRDPKNSNAYGAYGYFLEKCGEKKAAEEYYLKAINLAKNGSKGAAYNNYGAYLYRQKHHREAIGYFLKAIRERNYLHIAAAYENAGMAALGANDKKLAKIYFQKALENDPNRVYSRSKLN